MDFLLTPNLLFWLPQFIMKEFMVSFIEELSGAHTDVTVGSLFGTLCTAFC